MRFFILFQVIKQSLFKTRVFVFGKVIPRTQARIQHQDKDRGFFKVSAIGSGQKAEVEFFVVRF